MKRPCCRKCAEDYAAGLEAIRAAAGQRQQAADNLVGAMDSWHEVSHGRPAQGLAGVAGFETDFLPNRYEINAAADDLQSKILIFSRDFTARQSPGTDEEYQRFLSQWNAFVGDFNAWHGVFFWWSTWSRREELLQFRKRFNDLVAEYESLGGQTSDVVVPFDKQEISTDDQGPPSKWHSTMKWVAAGAIVLGGAYAIGKVAPIAKRALPPRKAA